MRPLQYLLILFGLTLIAVCALVLAGFAGLMNCQGLVLGFVLVNFECPRLGNVPLVSWIFDSFASGAGFPYLMAAGVTASIIVGSSLLVPLVSTVARQMLERREYVRRGDTESAFLATQNITGVAMWMALLELAGSCVIWGDLYLYRETTMSTATQRRERSVAQQPEQLVRSNPTQFKHRATKLLRTWSSEADPGVQVGCAQLSFWESL